MARALFRHGRPRSRLCPDPIYIFNIIKCIINVIIARALLRHGRLSPAPKFLAALRLFALYFAKTE